MKKKYNKGFSYQRKLTLIFAVMLVGIMVTFAAVMFRQQQKNETQKLYRTIHVETQKNAEALENNFESLRDLSAALVLNENIYSSIERLPYIYNKTDFYSIATQQDIFKTMLISKLATMKQLKDMRLYSINGMSVHVTRQYSNVENEHYWEQEWFEPFLEKEKDCMLLFSNKEDAQILTICRTVRELRGAKRVGYLEVNFDFTENIEDILEETTLTDGYCYYLLQEGKTVASRGQMEEKMEEISGGLVYGRVESIDLDKQEYLMVSYPIEKTNFVLLSGVDTRMFKGKWQRELLLFLLLLFVGSGAAVGVSAFAAGKMSRNIHKLNNAMKEAEKNPNIQVHITSNDEIGMLGDSFNKMILRLQKTYGDLYAAELDLKEAQYMALQAQINPHFLYNTLETIDALSVCERTEDIGRIVQALSLVFRYAMNKQRSVPFREELEHVSWYLEILEIRYEDRFTWEIQSDPALSDLEVPKIILQPLVENAIIHGVLKLEQKGHISICCKKTSEWILIEVSDNGKGMGEDTIRMLSEHLTQDSDREPNEGHIGVKNVDRRLRYYFGNRYHMDISSTPGSRTSITLCIRAKE